jgi:alpha-D-ribose 1-methylphosphonate 5-triphosphate synthase subunit PhnH
MTQGAATVPDGGFADPPVQAARAFRAAMEAMARPGSIHRVSGAVPPAPLSVAAGVLLLTLTDPETPLHLAGAADCAAVRGWIAFHTGAPLVGPEAAMFALGPWPALGDLGRYPAGTPDYPDRSATLIVELPALEPVGIALAGPGIRGRAALSLPDRAAFEANAARFPLGVDFFLTAGDRLAALPRSTRLLPGETD